MKSAAKALSAALLSLALPAAAQIPDEFTNLKLLPREIEKRELVGIMRGWAGGLGVRCNHCHVGPDNLEGMDFASDEKQTKRSARRMLEMSRAINGEHLAKLEQGAQPVQEVACYTCHRGQPKPPRQLALVLGEIAGEQGVDAAMTRYGELKEELYGAGVYDFRVGSLLALAQAVFERGQGAQAIQVLRSTGEIYPESADVHTFLGMAMMRTGDLEEAAASFRRALELDSDNAGAQRGLMLLEQRGGTEP